MKTTWKTAHYYGYSLLSSNLHHNVTMWHYNHIFRNSVPCQRPGVEYTPSHIFRTISILAPLIRDFSYLWPLSTKFSIHPITRRREIYVHETSLHEYFIGPCDLQTLPRNDHLGAWVSVETEKDFLVHSNSNYWSATMNTLAHPPRRSPFPRTYNLRWRGQSTLSFVRFRRCLHTLAV